MRVGSDSRLTVTLIPPPVFVHDVTFKAAVCVLAGCSPTVAGTVAVIVRAHRDAGAAEPGAGYSTREHETTVGQQRSCPERPCSAVLQRYLFVDGDSSI